MSRTKKQSHIKKTKNIIKKKHIKKQSHIKKTHIKKTKKTVNNNNNLYKYNTEYQNGGNIFTHWLNMIKFRKLVKDLQKEEKEISKYIDSYKINAKNFKDIAEDKSNKSTEYVLNKRQLIIINFSKPKDTDISYVTTNNKDFLKTVINYHDIEMIENKEKKLEIEMIEAEKSINKNLPDFIKDKKQLDKQSKKFRELVAKISSGSLGKFQAKVKLMKKEYDEIAPREKGTLKSIHKKALKKYLSHKADYETVVKIDDSYIQKQQDLVHEITDLLEQSEFYIEQMQLLDKKREDVDINIVKWEKIYTRIYELINKILLSIKNTKKIVEEIKKFETQIDIAIHPIAQTTTDINIKQSSKQIKNSRQDFESIIKYLDASAANINQVLEMLLNEKMASELYLDVTKIATAFESAENLVKKNLNLFIPNTITLTGGSARASASISPVSTGTSSKSSTKSGVTFATEFEIHPIIYNSSNNFDNLLNEYQGRGKLLFIYTDNFKDYSTFTRDIANANLKSSEKYREFRKDSTVKKTVILKNIYSLGIPIGIDDNLLKDEGKIQEKAYDYSTTSFESYAFNAKETDFNNKNFNSLLKTSMENIYAYIKKNNINHIFYYTYNPKYNIDPNIAPNLDLTTYLKPNTWTNVNKANLQKQFKNLIENIKPINIYTIDTTYFLPDTVIDSTDSIKPVIDLSKKIDPVDPTKTIDPKKQSLKEIPYQSSDKDRFYLYNLPQDTNGFLLYDNKKLNIKNPYGINKIFVDDYDNEINMKNVDKPIQIKGGQIATVTKDGFIFIDPVKPENSPLRSIITLFKNINKDKNQYDNNIKIIDDSSKAINDKLSKMNTKGSEFISLTILVQELSQKLLELKEIEPKVIKIELDKQKNIAKKYSWILKPVEINKSEFHALAGTETLDKLIRDNKEMQELWKKNSQVSSNDIDKIIYSLSHAPQNLPYSETQNLRKIIETNFSSLKHSIEEKYSSDKQALCNIYNSITKILGTIPPEVKNIINGKQKELSCGGKKEDKNKKKSYRNNGR